MPSRRDQNTLRPLGPPVNGSQRMMYNLGHAASSSSGNLVTRNADGTAVPFPATQAGPSSSLFPAAGTAAAAAAGGASTSSSYHPVPASEAPYLTNLESHFGRMTLTAPDNMRRKQAKEKKAKVRQKKSQNAQIAAAALAGVSLHPLGEAMRGSYEGAPASGPSGGTRPVMQRGISSGYSSSGNATPAGSGGRVTPVGHAMGTTNARSRRRPAANARLAVPGGNDERSSSRAAPRSGNRAVDQQQPSRPASSLSQDAASGATAATAAASQQGRTRRPSGEEVQRSRSDSAPAASSGGDGIASAAVAAAHADAAGEPATSASAEALSGEQASISSAMAQQASLRRYNIWNDIAGLPGADEPDPDDLPPPFPEGATRPRTPPQPPPAGREWTEEERLAYEEAERWRVPDSPPPAFRTDSEGEGSGAEGRRLAVRSSTVARRPRRSGARRQASVSLQAGPSQSQEGSSSARRLDEREEDVSLSESSASEGGAEIEAEPAEERQAWEADLRAGLSFEERLMREQERRDARERALLIARGVVRADTSADGIFAAERDDGERELVAAEDEGEEGEGGTVDPAATFRDADGTGQSLREGPVPAAASSNLAASPQVTDGRDGMARRDGEELQGETADQDEGEGEDEDEDDHFEEVQARGIEPQVPIGQNDGIGISAAAEASLQAAVDVEDDTFTTPATEQLSPRSSALQAVTSEATSSSRTQSTQPRPILHNEPRLGPLAPSSSSRSALGQTSVHRRTASDSLTEGQKNGKLRVPLSARQIPTRIRSRPASESHSRFRDDATAAAERRGRLWSRTDQRPEDMLFTVSAPPARNLAPGEAPEGSGVDASALARASRSAVEGRRSSTSSSDDEDEDEPDGLRQSDAVESDDSADQWMAEAAAFDALRRREEEAAEKLRKLRMVPRDGMHRDDISSSSSSDDDEGPADPRVPGHFEPRRAAVPASPGLNRLAAMSKNVARAPPPLVLGRSRGGAAFSSSSGSSDTDDGRLPSSSGSETDDDFQTGVVEVKPLPQQQQQRQSPESASQSSGPATSPAQQHTFVQPRPTESKANIQNAQRASPSAPALSKLPVAAVPTPDPRQRGSDGPYATSTSSQNAPAVPEKAPENNKAGQSSVLGATAPTAAVGLTRRETIYVPITLRMAEEKPSQVEDRAGTFQQDTASSRDVSSAEDEPVQNKPLSLRSRPTVQASSRRPSLSARKSTNSYSKDLPTPPGEAPATATASASLSRSPAEASSNAKAALGSRLRGLFGTPLVDMPPKVQTPSANDESASKGKKPVRPSDSETVNRGLSLQRRPSARSIKSTRSRQEIDEQDLVVESAASRAPSLHRKPSSTSVRSAVSRKASSSSMSLVPVEASTVASVRKPSLKRTESSSERVEQRARDEALAQIAHLQSTSAARQDSLAALERLLARTSRPAPIQTPPPPPLQSASPPPPTGFDPVAPRQLASGSHRDGAREADGTIALPTSSVTDPDQQPRWPGANRLSRQGAMYRSRDGGPPPPPPVSYNMRPSARPSSFVNPRSSVAPLPRGRLPTITDATRHFPPSRQATGMARTPSWLAQIPSDEREKLPPPLEPERLATSSSAADPRQAVASSSGGSAYRNAEVPMPAPLRTAGSRVSAMISKFEAPGSPQAATFSAASAVPFASGDSPDMRQWPSPAAAASSTNPFHSSSSTSEHGRTREEALSRRPPPPPPSTRQAHISASPAIQLSPRPMSTTALAPLGQTSAHPLLATAGATPSAMLAPPGSQFTSAGASASASASQLTRSPRTQALDLLTSRESGSAHPLPNLPPKSPLLPPDQLFHPSRRGLNQTIAAAQAAAQARREQRSTIAVEPRSARDELMQRGPLPVPRDSGDGSSLGGRPLAGLFGSQGIESGMAYPVSQPGLFGSTSARTASPKRAEGPRPLPSLPDSVRQWDSPGGASTSFPVASRPAASGSGYGYAPVLPPRPPSILQNRPRDRISDGVSPTIPVASPLPPSSTTRRDPFAQRSWVPPQHQNGGEDNDHRDFEHDEPAQSSPPSSSVNPVAAEPSAANLISAAASAIGRSGSVRDIVSPSETGSGGVAPPPARPATEEAPTGRRSTGLQRAPSLGYTDLDLLVSQLESMQSSSAPTGGGDGAPSGQGNDYDLLTTLSEFLGPAKPTVASAAEISTLPLAKVECERRRVTREGKVRQKLSVAGVRVERCGVCLDQFREGNWAVLCRCTHVLHEGCARRLFGMVRRCPTCRRDCFVDEEEEEGTRGVEADGRGWGS